MLIIFLVYSIVSLFYDGSYPYVIYFLLLSVSLRFNGHFPGEPGLASVL